MTIPGVHARRGVPAYQAMKRAMEGATMSKREMMLEKVVFECAEEIAAADAMAIACDVVPSTAEILGPKGVQKILSRIWDCYAELAVQNGGPDERP